MHDDYTSPTPPGCRTKLTLSFDVFFHFNMTPADVARMGLEAEVEMLSVLRKASSKYELDKYGSRSDVISLSGVTVGDQR